MTRVRNDLSWYEMTLGTKCLGNENVKTRYEITKLILNENISTKTKTVTK